MDPSAWSTPRAPRRGEPIVAQPFQSCADLPGAPQPQIYIDAQVNVGGDQTGTDGGSGSGGGRPRGPRPAADQTAATEAAGLGRPVQPRPSTGR